MSGEPAEPRARACFDQCRGRVDGIRRHGRAAGVRAPGSKSTVQTSHRPMRVPGRGSCAGDDEVSRPGQRAQRRTVRVAGAEDDSEVAAAVSCGVHLQPDEVGKRQTQHCPTSVPPCRPFAEYPSEMSDDKDVRPVHVFDQTNGLMKDDDTDDANEKRPRGHSEGRRGQRRARRPPDDQRSAGRVLIGRRPRVALAG